MSTTSEHLSVRLTPEGADTLGRVAEAMGVSASALIEIQARRALAGDIPPPPKEYTAWMERQMAHLRGPLVIANRRLTPGGKGAVEELAEEWTETHSGVVEYLVWYSGRTWPPQRSAAA